MYILGLGSNFCLMFIAFVPTRDTVSNCCQPPLTNIKRLEPTNAIRERFLLIPGYVLPRGLA